MQMNSIEDSDSFSLFTEISPSRTERDRIYLDTMTRKISPLLALLGSEEVFARDSRHEGVSFSLNLGTGRGDATRVSDVHQTCARPCRTFLD